MKIKQGYKQTDIGIIPEDWEVKTLSKIATFENGKAHEQFIDDSGNWVVVNSKFISTEGQIAKFSNVGISPLKVGNIAIVMSDIPNGKALAKCFLVKKNDRYTLNQRIGAIIANENIDNDFLYYKLNRNEYFLSFDSGSGQTNLRKNEIVECPLAFPLTKQEQQAIAQTLSNIDSLIEALNKKIAKKRAIKEGAMQQLLTGKKRLAGFSEDWIEKKFEQIVDKQIKKGQMLTASEYIEGNIPVIAGGKTPAGYHAYANREKNTITISASGANAGFVAFHCNPIFATDCSTISESNKFDIKYIYYLLCLNQDIIYKAQIGGAQPHIHAKDIYPLEVFYTTDIKEQQSIAQILTDMDNEIELLEKERQKYTVLKQGAMQKLLQDKFD